MDGCISMEMYQEYIKAHYDGGDMFSCKWTLDYYMSSYHIISYYITLCMYCVCTVCLYVLCVVYLYVIIAVHDIIIAEWVNSNLPNPSGLGVNTNYLYT